jgi:conjugal transfer pilus assembly protein TraE
MNYALNFNPATARSQFEKLLTFYAPDEFPSAQQEYYRIAETIETSGQISSIYYIQGIKVDKERHQIETTGLKRQFTHDKVLNNGIVTYFIDYTINNGRFIVKKLYQKPA